MYDDFSKGFEGKNSNGSYAATVLVKRAVELPRCMDLQAE